MESFFQYKNDAIDSIVDEILDARHLTWNDIGMSWHFYFGAGKGVTLEQIDLLEEVREHYRANYFDRFLNDIDEAAYANGIGSFSETFSKSYRFTDVSYFFGNSAIYGEFQGRLSQDSRGEFLVEGNVLLEMRDVFDDPLNIQTVIDREFSKYLKPSDGISINDVVERLYQNNNLGGTAFSIYGRWQEVVQFHLGSYSDLVKQQLFELNIAQKIAWIESKLVDL